MAVKASNTITLVKVSDGATGPAGATGPIGETLSNGKLLFRDPTFITSNNSIGIYNNGTAGTVQIDRIERQADCPSDSQFQIRIRNTGAASPGMGGFFWGVQTRASAIFIYRIIAKVPVGRSIAFASNAHGSNPIEKWLTSTAGTGRYEEYIYKLTCGSTGTFSTAGHFYLNGGASGTTSAPLDWFLAYAAVFDMTGIEVDYEKLIENTKTQITQEYSSLLSKVDEQINMMVRKITTTENGLSTLTQSVANNMSLTEEDISFVKTTQETLEKALGNKLDTITLQEYIRFNGANIELGKSNSEFKAVLTNTELGFYRGGNKIAYFSNNELHVIKIEVEQSLKIGGFSFVLESNGSLSITI